MRFAWWASGRRWQNKRCVTGPFGRPSSCLRHSSFCSLFSPTCSSQTDGTTQPGPQFLYSLIADRRKWIDRHRLSARPQCALVWWSPEENVSFRASFSASPTSCRKRTFSRLFCLVSSHGWWLTCDGSARCWAGFELGMSPVITITRCAS